MEGLVSDPVVGHVMFIYTWSHATYRCILLRQGDVMT